MGRNNDTFEEICDKLRSNDPRCRSVRTCSSWPQGYLRLLGESLLASTHVAYLFLFMDKNLLFIQDDDNDNDERTLEISALPLLQFIRESKSLEFVFLGTSMSQSERNFPGYAMRLVGKIMTAVAENPNIRRFRMEQHGFVYPPVSLGYLIRNTKSIRSFLLSLELSAHEERHGLDAIIPSALRANSSFAELTLMYGTTNVDLVQRTLLELRHHPVLQTLTLESGGWRGIGHDLPVVQSLAQILQTTKQLNEIVLDRLEFTLHSLECLLHGIATNQTLRTLSFRHCTFDEAATSMFLSFMQSTQHTSSSFQSIGICGRRVFAGASIGFVTATSLMIPDGYKSK